MNLCKQICKQMTTTKSSHSWDFHLISHRVACDLGERGIQSFKNSTNSIRIYSHIIIVRLQFKILPQLITHTAPRSNKHETLKQSQACVSQQKSSLVTTTLHRTRSECSGIIADKTAWQITVLATDWWVQWHCRLQVNSVRQNADIDQLKSLPPTGQTYRQILITIHGLANTLVKPITTYHVSSYIYMLQI